jgi:hypothetical protein
MILVNFKILFTKGRNRIWFIILFQISCHSTFLCSIASGHHCRSELGVSLQRDSMYPEVFVNHSNIYFHCPCRLTFKTKSLCRRHHHVFVSQLWLNSQQLSRQTLPEPLRLWTPTLNRNDLLPSLEGHHSDAIATN